MTSRRQFVGGLLGAAMVSRVGAASLPEAPLRDTAEMAPPLFPKTGPHYNPVVTLNGWALPWRMNDGWWALVDGERQRQRHEASSSD